jgi:hypothetical protein
MEVTAEGILDAHLVSPEALKRRQAVVIARLRYKSGPGTESVRYGVKAGADYYVVVRGAPGNSSDHHAEWAVYQVNNNNTYFVVRTGSNYRPCKAADGSNHGQKPAPEVRFAGCDAAMLPFETLKSIEALAAIPADSQSAHDKMLVQSLPPAGRKMLDDPVIWITCGLGCCTMEE